MASFIISATGMSSTSDITYEELRAVVLTVKATLKTQREIKRMILSRTAPITLGVLISPPP
jgi:hypothetical protein